MRYRSLACAMMMRVKQVTIRQTKLIKYLQGSNCKSIMKIIEAKQDYVCNGIAYVSMRKFGNIYLVPWRHKIRWAYIRVCKVWKGERCNSDLFCAIPYWNWNGMCQQVQTLTTQIRNSLTFASILPKRSFKSNAIGCWNVRCCHRQSNCTVEVNTERC